MAGATGGSFRDSSAGGLANVYQAVNLAELAKTYVLTYRTSASDHVTLAISADGVTARTGYAAGKAPVTRTATGIAPQAITRSAWSSFARRRRRVRADPVRDHRDLQPAAAAGPEQAARRLQHPVLAPQTRRVEQ